MPTKLFTCASTQPEGRRERFRFQLYEQLRRPDFQFCAPNIAKSFPPLEERSMEIDIVVEFFILSLSHHRKNVEVFSFFSKKRKLQHFQKTPKTIKISKGISMIKFQHGCVYIGMELRDSDPQIWLNFDLGPLFKTFHL